MKSIPLFPDYFIDDNGNSFRKTPKGLIPKKQQVKNGRPVIEIDTGKKGRKRFMIHSLVAKLYLTHPDNGCMCVRHIDGNLFNNRVTNLYYSCHSAQNEKLINEATVRKEDKGRQKLGAAQLRRIELDATNKDIIERLSLKRSTIAHSLLADAVGNIYWDSPNGIVSKSQTVGRGGYLKVTICIGSNSRKKIPSHRLIANAFLGEPPKDKPHVLHKDDNKLNNRIENLYYGDNNDNMRDASINGRKAKKLTEEDVRYIRKRELGYKKLSKMFGVSHGTIKAIWKRKIWFHI